MKKGFTLIEILVSFVILTVIISSSAYLLKSLRMISKTNSSFLLAINKAQYEMESGLSKGFKEVPSDKNIKIERIDISGNIEKIKFSYFWDKKKKPIVFYTIKAKD